MVNVVRPTLGPSIRHVALARDPANKSPEMLDDAGTIARRIIEIPDPYANMGAMLARHVMWNVREAVGDGSATAAVLMQALVSEAARLAAAGWNVMMMRQGIEQGLSHAVSTLRAMSRPIESEAAVVGLTLAASGDPDLAKRMGEIYDTLGGDCHIEVQESYTPGIRHEYIEGAYWRSGWVSSSFANNDLANQTKLTDAYVLVVDGHVENWQQISSTLELVAKQPNPALVVVAYDVKDTALALMLGNKDKVPSVAVKAPGYGDHMKNMLQDFAIQTGARVFLTNLGESMAKVSLADLGRARSVTANRDYFGMTGGSGDPRALRERIATLREQITESRQAAQGRGGAVARAAGQAGRRHCRCLCVWNNAGRDGRQEGLRRAHHQHGTPGPIGRGRAGRRRRLHALRPGPQRAEAAPGASRGGGGSGTRSGRAAAHHRPQQRSTGIGRGLPGPYPGPRLGLQCPDRPVRGSVGKRGR